MVVHLTYGGSTAHRTVACPGWVKKSEDLPKRPPGDAAIEGSMHHEVMERCQRDDVDPVSLLGLVYKEPGTDISREFTDDDLDLAEIAHNTTNALLDRYQIDTMELESFVQLVPGEAGGSIDLIGGSEDGTVVLLLDYKFGAVRVPAEESPNLALYAISARQDKSTADLFAKAEKIVFVIMQPRLQGVTAIWETTPEWLNEFEKRFRAAITLDDISPGAHCKYCPAEAYCGEKRQSVVAANLLSADQQDDLNKAATMVVEVEAWVKSIKEEMFLQMTRGVPVPGWKIVAKRATRKWIDEAAAAAKIKLPKKIKFKTVLLTPAQMEKVLKKRRMRFDITPLVDATSSGNTIAPEDAPGDAIQASELQGHLATMVQ